VRFSQALHWLVVSTREVCTTKMLGNFLNFILKPILSLGFFKYQLGGFPFRPAKHTVSRFILSGRQGYAMKSP